MEPISPYTPPSAALEPESAIPIEQRLASQGARFANYLIDQVGQVMVGALLGVAAALGAVPLSEEPGPLTNLAFGAVSALLYYVPLEALTGRTLGKLITGTRVVTETGGPPDVATVLVRTLCRFVPFEAFSFFGTPCVGWHDSWSKTRVIKTR